MSIVDPTSRWSCTGEPPLSEAILRSTPEDFTVEEQIDIPLSGAGEHVWLHVRKRGVNTEFVARSLARAFGVPSRAVSYAGMKDRHAVATQWFSVHLAGRATPDVTASLPSGVDVLAVQRHARKLQRGALSGNRFGVVLRACRGDRERTLRRATDVARSGVPNYFGEQRFGREQDNIVRAEEMFRGAPVRDRHLRGVYLSTARSLIFNEVLARRVADASWNTAHDGDVFSLNGSNSFFVPDAIDETIRRRLADGDIHTSGPLWGAGEPPSRAQILALESDVGHRFPLLADGLARADLAQERRPLRLIPRDITAEWLDETTLRLAFSLPAGSYATTVVREFARYSDVGHVDRPAIGQKR